MFKIEAKCILTLKNLFKILRIFKISCNVANKCMYLDHLLNR